MKNRAAVFDANISLRISACLVILVTPSLKVFGAPAGCVNVNPAHCLIGMGSFQSHIPHNLKKLHFSAKTGAAAGALEDIIKCGTNSEGPIC